MFRTRATVSATLRLLSAPQPPSDYSYTPQYTVWLSQSNQWTDLTQTNGTGEAATVLDPVLNAIRFYRVQRQRTP